MELHVDLDCRSPVHLKRDLSRFVGQLVATDSRVPDALRSRAEFAQLPADTLDHLGGDCGVLQGVTLEEIAPGYYVPLVEADWGMAWAVFPDHASVRYTPAWSLDGPPPDRESTCSCGCIPWPGYQFPSDAKYDPVIKHMVAYEPCPNCGRHDRIHSARSHMRGSLLGGKGG